MSFNLQFLLRGAPVVFILLMLVPGFSRAQSVVINEVMINGPGGCDGNCTPNTEEWVELYNSSCVAVNIGCYRLCDGDFCITIPAGTVLPAQGYYLIGSSNSVIGSASLDLNIGTCNSCASGPISQVGIFYNIAEQIVLTNPAGVIVDAIIWGGGQAIPETLTAGAGAGCFAEDVTLPGATSNVYENIGFGGGGNGCVMARSLDGGMQWEERCPGPLTPSPTPGATNNPGLSVSFMPSDCPGQAVSITAHGGTGLFSWSPSTGLNSTTGNTVTASPTVTTTYTFTSLSLFGCLTSVSGLVTISVGMVGIPAVTASATPAIVCPGTSTALTASGASTYSWVPHPTLSATTGNVVTATPTTNTTYTVIGTTANGCSSSAMVTVTTQTNLNVGIMPASPQHVCAGNQLSLTASGAANYSWSTGQTGSVITVSPLATTTYSVTGYTGACSGAAVIPVTVVQPPVVAVSAGQTSICAGNSTSLTASGATDYTWSTGQTGPVISVNPGATTTYSVTGTSAGCSATQSVTVSVLPLPTVAVSPAQPMVCPGDTITLTATGADTFSWAAHPSLSNTVGSIVTALPATTTNYTVTGFSGDCSNTAIVFLQMGAAGVAVAGDDIVENCGQTIVQLAALTPPEGIGNWAVLSGNGAVFSSVSTPVTTFSGLAGTTYVVTWTVETACGAGTDTLAITINEAPVVSVSDDVAIMLDETVVLSAAGGVEYSWIPAIGLSDNTVANPVASPEKTTNYTVLVTTEEGCTDSAFVTVVVNYDDLFIPNVFTPNSDGVNDTWDIKGLRVVYPECEVRIFSRWGTEVFYSKGYGLPWDGRSGGEYVNDGVYFYYLKLGAGHESIKGTLSILR